jgi:ribosomal protein S18 acetylase RimI-like enzyme
MAPSELDRIGEIDRSERITQEYTYVQGSLEQHRVDIDVDRWSRTGDGDDSVPGNIAAWRPILERGGTLIGAFAADTLVGCAVYRPDLAPEMANLAALYVGSNFRGRNIGSLLTDEVLRLARAGGARRLYVSATPTVATVDFYRSHGFEPTNEPHPDLFAREPLDIHMILDL